MHIFFPKQLLKVTICTFRLQILYLERKQAVHRGRLLFLGMTTFMLKLPNLDVEQQHPSDEILNDFQQFLMVVACFINLCVLN